MTSTLSKIHQVTSKPSIGYRAECHLDRVGAILWEIERAARDLDTELGDLRGLISEDADKIVDDVRGAAQAMPHTLSAFLRRLYREVEAAADADDAAAVS